MVESSLCPTCSSPVLPGQAYCPTCGTPLPGGAVLEAAAGTPDDPRLAALGLSRVAPPEPERPQTPPTPAAARPSPSPDQFANQFAAPASAPILPPEVAMTEPSEDPSERIPDAYVPPLVDPEASAWTLRPSSVSSAAKPAGPGMSLSLGAIPFSSASQGNPAAGATPAPPPAASSAIWPPAQPAQPGPFAPFAQPAPLTQPAPPAPFPGPFVAPPVRGAPGAFFAPTPYPPAPMPAAAPAEASPASDVPARKESMQELVSFGLVAAGAAIGIASLFLPWANGNGIGIGNYQSGNAPPNQWGWGAPAGIPLFLVGVLVLAAISGSDRAQARLPNLAPVIRQVSDVIMPMVLGGLYAGVFLLYLTLPNGYGVGAFVLFVAACLLIGGAVITLFFPPEVAGSPDQRGALEPDETPLDR